MGSVGSVAEAANEISLQSSSLSIAKKSLALDDSPRNSTMNLDHGWLYEVGQY